jgi:hypothetical protein
MFSMARVLSLEMHTAVAWAPAPGSNKLHEQWFDYSSLQLCGTAKLVRILKRM